MSNNKLLKGNIMEINCLLETPQNVQTMIRAIKKYVSKDFTILLTIEGTVDELHSKVGQACSNGSDFLTKMSEIIQDEEDPLIYVFMGKMILNELMPSKYFIKSEIDKIVYEIRSAE